MGAMNKDEKIARADALGKKMMGCGLSMMSVGCAIVGLLILIPLVLLLL